MFAKILVPVDFGACSAHATEFAGRLVDPGGSLHLVYVLDEAIVLPFDGQFDLSDIEEAAARSLDELAHKTAEGLSAKVETEILHGTVSEEILERGVELGCDLVVVGSHGRKGLRRLLLGSVAERLVRAARLPICVVREEGGGSGRLERIGLATDFSDAAAGAQAMFRRILAAHEGARGFIYHVVEDAAWLADFTIPTATIERNFELLEAGRRQKLDGLVASLQADGLAVEGRLEHGVPWEVLARRATDDGLDLLVLGTHGYRGMDRFFIGSVAEKAVRTVSAPTLVVPGRAS